MRDPLSAPVTEIMSTHVSTTTPDTPVRHAADLMLAVGISGLPVVDDSRRLLGVLSLADVTEALTAPVSKQAIDSSEPIDPADEALARTLQLLLPLEELGEGAVADFMTPHPVTLSLHATIRDAAECMVSHRVHRVCIIDSDRLVGLVSTMDVLAGIAG